MSHLTCTNCGQKAPVEATRCKGCGRPFGRPPRRPGDSGSRRSSIAVALLLVGTALMLVVAYRLWPGFSVGPSVATQETTTVAAPPPPAPKESRASPADSVRPAAPSTPQPPKKSPASVVDTARRVVDSAAPVEPPTPRQPVSIDPAHQRYAQDWVKLREEPSNTAAVLRVLQPGEVVTVDSLLDGWYRVVLDQRVGYVDRQYLDTLPPPR